MRRQSKGYEIDMCNGTLANKILLFALPLMASSLLQLLFNAPTAPDDRPAIPRAVS